MLLLRTMKKNVYNAPEMEVVKLSYRAALLDASFNENTDMTIPTEPDNEQAPR